MTNVSSRKSSNKIHIQPTRYLAWKRYWIKFSIFCEQHDRQSRQRRKWLEILRFHPVTSEGMWIHCFLTHFVWNFLILIKTLFQASIFNRMLRKRRIRHRSITPSHTNQRPSGLLSREQTQKTVQPKSDHLPAAGQNQQSSHVRWRAHKQKPIGSWFEWTYITFGWKSTWSGWRRCRECWSLCTGRGDSCIWIFLRDATWKYRIPKSAGRKYQ